MQVGKRFFKADDQSQDAQTGFFAKLAARDKVAMKRAEEERRARKVALTRSYRKGDLPDIQVIDKKGRGSLEFCCSGVLC